MRAFDKKKTFRLMTSTKQRAGFINDASGSWVSADSTKYGATAGHAVAGASHGRRNA